MCWLKLAAMDLKNQTNIHILTKSFPQATVFMLQEQGRQFSRDALLYQDAGDPYCIIHIILFCIHWVRDNIKILQNVL